MKIKWNANTFDLTWKQHWSAYCYKNCYFIKFILWKLTINTRNRKKCPSDFKANIFWEYRYAPKDIQQQKELEFHNATFTLK